MKKLTLLVCCTLMIVACKKIILPEEAGQTARSDNQNAVSSALPTSSSLLYRGLYLDSTSYIIGDTVKENKVLNWCVANKIKTITYYDIKRTLELGKSAQLANFLKRARTDYGIQENSVVAASYNRIQTNIDTFNNAKTDTLKRFNWVHFELEWWNDEATFTAYITELSAIKAWGLTQTPKIRTENYIGWFDNPAGQDSLQASTIIQNTDRIHVHDYYPTPSWSYIRSRIDYLGRAAYALGKTAKLITIFDADATVSGPYFQTNTFESAYQTVIDGYNAATTLPKKANVDMIGYQLFSYTETSAARPLPSKVNFSVSNSPSKPVSGQIRIYDNTNTLIDMQTFAANTNTLKLLKQPNSWRLEIDATNTGSVRYVMEIYVDGNIVDYYYLSANSTRTVMKVPYPSGFHNLSGNVTLSIYPD